MSSSDDLQQPLLPHKQDARSQAAQPDTFWPCVINLVKVITGAGMMAIPRAFLQIGWLPGSCMLLGVAGLSFFTLAVLVQGSAVTQASTYGELVARTCGAGLMRLLQLAVLLFCFGFSVVYIVVIRDLLLGDAPACNGLLCEVFGPAATHIDASLLVIVVALLVIAPLLTLRRMDKLAALNAAGVAATVLLAVVAAALATVALATGRAYSIPMLPQWELLGPTRGEQLEALTDVLPVILASYVAHQSLHPLMPLLKPYSQARMLKVIATALAISGTIFLTLSVGAAAAFGPDTDVNVLSNLSIAGLEPLLGWRLAVALSWALRGGYLVCILATLLLYMHPLRSCLAQMLWPQPAALQAAAAPPTAVAAAAAAAEAEAAAAVQQRGACHSADPAVAASSALAGSPLHDPVPPHIDQLQQHMRTSAVSQQGGDAEQQLGQQQQQQLCSNEQQQQQQQVQSQRQQPVLGSTSPQMWQELEQSVYYPLTYGLLAAQVLVAVAVTNIYQAVSAVGDIASTMQAFIVPGAIALTLVVSRWWTAAAHAASTGGVGVAAVAAVGAVGTVHSDVEAGQAHTPAYSGVAAGVAGSKATHTLALHTAGRWLYAAGGAAVLLLGVALFANGVFERVSYVI